MINRLLSIAICFVFDHAPVVEIRGAGSCLVCERCGKLLNVFVMNVFKRSI